MTSVHGQSEDVGPRRSAGPVIDAHNHLWGSTDIREIVRVMDEVGIIAYADVTANARVTFEGGGTVLREGDFDVFLNNVMKKYPGRFYGFTMSRFARPSDTPLFTDAGRFVAETLETLREHVAKGARGLKILKELGLKHRDGEGNLITVDDERFDPIWAEAGQLGVPVLMHQADPSGFFEPITPENEHYDSLLKYSDWSFADPKFPRKEELLERRNRVIARHPNTTFLLPHVANWPENLPAVGELLDAHPNVYIDVSARIDELGRRPVEARKFLIRYQDRVLFGTDMPVSTKMYRCYFRFLETDDEGFFAPDYDGTFERHRWPIQGLRLPQDVLQKIYSQNALRIIPHLRKDVKRTT